MIAEAPPDATPFRSQGRDCYLYLGALEMRALQREWGLVRSVADTTADWARKQVEFTQRLEGETFEDKFAVLKHGLARWSRAAGIELTDESAADVLDRIEGPRGKARASGRILRMAQLHQQFMADCFGGDVEDEAGPKDQSSTSTSEPDSSTQTE